MTESTKNNLRIRSWLPLVDGTGVAPENCVCTEGLESIIAKLRRSGAVIAHKGQLKPELTSPQEWNKKVRHLCPDGAAIIELIGRELLRVGGYEIGQKAASQYSFEEFLNVFRKSPPDLMPVVEVIDAIRRYNNGYGPC